ncbi:hypothetical protein ScPMuIL_012245 [Solemya velum]
MESKYDKVAYPDSAYLATSEHGDFGTGVYSVSYKDYRRENTFKLACFRIHKRRKRTIYFVCGMVVVLVIIIGIIIALTGSRTNAGQPAVHKMMDDKKIGLDFYPKPLDGSNLIKFSMKSSTYMQYTKNLDYHVHVYSPMEQSGKEYDRCNNNTRPEGKQCRFDMQDLGECSNMNQYGYGEQRPCVLLMLKPPNGTKPVLFEPDNIEVNKYFQPQWSPNANETFGTRWSPDHVAVSCRGETRDDVKFMGKSEPVLKFIPIAYMPANGFPMKFYPAVSNPNYRYPGVMVQFNTILTNKRVSVKCTAWAKNFNNGHPETSTEYTASFSLLIY